LLRRMFRLEGRPTAAVDDLFLYVFLGVVVGARLGHVLFYDPSYYFRNPLEIPMLWKGGLASHGALVGVLLALYFFHRRHPRFSYLWLLDRLALVVSLGAAAVRVGNFFNSEIYGRPAEVPWAVVFARVDQLPRHPTQLYEAACYTIILAVMLFLYEKRLFRDREGFYSGLLLVLMFSARFLVEFTKERQASFAAGWPLSMGQVLSVVPVLAGLALVGWALQRTPKKGGPAHESPS